MKRSQLEIVDAVLAVLTLVENLSGGMRENSVEPVRT
jgi:hypothetical protein